MKFYFDLQPWQLYPEAERLLGRYVARLSKGNFDKGEKKVFHNTKISKEKQAKIRGYAEALNDGQVGHP